MVNLSIEATIFYRYSPSEVVRLAKAIEPLGENIRAVGSDVERQRLRAILQSNYFRRSDVTTVKNMLVRAAKHARGHMHEYFPQMRAGLIAQAETLEDAVREFHARFVSLASETIPVN